MNATLFKQNRPYILLNAGMLAGFILCEIAGILIPVSALETRLLFRVLARGILGASLVFNALYLLLTPRWSFLCQNATPRQRVFTAILLGLVGLFGLVTAILGYGTNGDPRLLWWI